MKRMDSYGNIYDDELMHYGKKGMKWGKHLKAQDYQYVGRDRNISTGGLGINGSRQRQYSKVQALQYNKPSSVSAKGYGANTKTSATAKALSSTLRNNGGKVNGGRIGNNEVTKKAASHVVPTSMPAVKGVNTSSKGSTGNAYRTGSEFVNALGKGQINTNVDRSIAAKRNYDTRKKNTSYNVAANSGIRATQNKVGNNYFDKDAADKSVKNAQQKAINKKNKNYFMYGNTATNAAYTKINTKKAVKKAVKKTLSSVKKKPSTISMGKTVVKGLFRRLFG